MYPGAAEPESWTSPRVRRRLEVDCVAEEEVGEDGGHWSTVAAVGEEGVATGETSFGERIGDVDRPSPVEDTSPAPGSRALGPADVVGKLPDSTLIWAGTESVECVSCPCGSSVV